MTSSAAPLGADAARTLTANFDLRALPADFYANPWPTYHALREHAPIKRLPDGSVFLTRHADLTAVYRDAKTFTSDKKKEFGPKYGAAPLFEHHTTSLVFNDPPLHTRVRRLIMGALTQRAIAGMAPGSAARPSPRAPRCICASARQTATRRNSPIRTGLTSAAIRTVLWHSASASTSAPA